MLPTASICAALNLPRTHGTKIRSVLAAAARVLAARDARDDGAPVRLPHRNAVHGARLAVHVRLDGDSDAGPRLLIEVVDRRGGDVEAAAAILSHVVLDVLRGCPADVIEWGASGALIQRDDFITLASYTSPRRAPGDQTARPALPADMRGCDTALRAARTPLRGFAIEADALRMTLSLLIGTVLLPVTAVISALGVLRSA
jgi:hypothetical protein